MNDEKSEKNAFTIRVKIPREKIELPPCLKYGWIAFAIFAVLSIVFVLVAIFCNCAEVSLGIGPMIGFWTRKISHFHLMQAIMLSLGFTFILLLLYFVHCHYVLGIARENRKAEKDRMDFISQQVDMLKNLGVDPVTCQRTETKGGKGVLVTGGGAQGLQLPGLLLERVCIQILFPDLQKGCAVFQHLFAHGGQGFAGLQPAAVCDGIQKHGTANLIPGKFHSEVPP